ncbi:hypothetical protein [Hymenobacter psychrophilus]|uniref:Uncharacterized protein n=1 Tax=Hymenobacter psychrophilus TaxID=651662 RepID=A0A1H3ITU2_9BACT|nr:hypothetical protein [Hymenobacter psychrophilus]SDY30304.1 hypothetical protein SAMN04488069_107127 [Hymenobacter psychrophilus]
MVISFVSRPPAPDLYPPQLPELVVHQLPTDAAEAARLNQLAQLVTASLPLSDLRDLAPAIRGLFPPPAYLVGCGGAHIWLHRTGESQRLALVR